MRKRFLATGILSLMAFSIILACFSGDSKPQDSISENVEQEHEKETVTIEEKTEIIVSVPETPTTEESTTLSLIDKMNDEIANIPYDFNNMEQKQNWFLAYKEIIEKYPEELHMSTIYETYNSGTLELLFRIVQSEVGDEYDFDEKANVASVIFNRLNSGNYDSLTDVLTAKGQFSPYSSGVYLNVEVDEKTILACEYVFLFGDTTGGCYGFQMKWIENWNGWTPVFRDDCHTFYKKSED